MIVLSLIGDAALAQRLDALPGRVEAGLARTLAQLSRKLQGAVQAKLDGPVLAPRTGRLRDSIAAAVTIAPAGVAAQVGSDVAYAAIHEFGGQTLPHEIRTRKAQALSFLLGGKQVFARRVQHPGSRLPERSFLRAALAEMKPQILDEIGAAVREGAAP